MTVAYQHVRLADLSKLDASGELPALLVGLTDNDLSDLSWVGAPLSLTLSGTGYWPIIVADDPPFDPDTHRLSDPVEGEPDPETKNIPAVREVVALTVDEIAARNPVPAQVSAAQACLILAEDGLLDRVTSIVAAMPRAIQIWFERANNWERASPYVAGIGLELDLTDADLDDKFRRAARRL